MKKWVNGGFIYATFLQWVIFMRFAGALQGFLGPIQWAEIASIIPGFTTFCGYILQYDLFY